jgi:hypothetical protein
MFHLVDWSVVTDVLKALRPYETSVTVYLVTGYDVTEASKLQ